MKTYRETIQGQDSFIDLMHDDYQDWLALVSHSRNSDCLSDSNFFSALNQLGGESETVKVFRFTHWMVGWIDVIMIQPGSASQAIAEQIEKSLADYPCLDEEDYSRREYEKALELWKELSIRERADYVKRSGGLSSHVSRFTLRHANCLPDTDSGDLEQLLATE